MKTNSCNTFSLLLATLLAAVLLFFEQALAENMPHVQQTNGQATLLVDAPEDKGQIAIRLADVLPIALEVTGGMDLEVKLPEKISVSSGWRLVAASPARTSNDGAKTRWQQTFTFEPLAPGSLTLTIEPLMVRDGGGDFRRLAWKPLSVQVSTKIASPSLNDLRDPTVIESLPPTPDSKTVPWLLLVVGSSAGILAILVYRRLRHRVGPRVSQPQRRALRDLERLLALELHNKGMGEKFHTLLTKIVRHYLDARWQLPARHRTTRELVELLQACGKLSDQEQAFLRDFFEHCDLVKFARADVSPKESLDLAEKTRAFLNGQGVVDVQT